jgi:hypothetical protein
MIRNKKNSRPKSFHPRQEEIVITIARVKVATVIRMKTVTLNIMNLKDVLIKTIIVVDKITDSNEGVIVAMETETTIIEKVRIREAHLSIGEVLIIEEMVIILISKGDTITIIDKVDKVVILIDKVDKTAILIEIETTRTGTTRAKPTKMEISIIEIETT